MENYKKMYLTLFNAITDAIEALHLEEYKNAEERLVRAQQETEELYICGARSSLPQQD